MLKFVLVEKLSLLLFCSHAMMHGAMNNLKTTTRRMIPVLAQIVKKYLPGYKIEEIARGEKIKAREFSYSARIQLEALPHKTSIRSGCFLKRSSHALFSISGKSEPSRRFHPLERRFAPYRRFRGQGGQRPNTSRKEASSRSQSARRVLRRKTRVGRTLSFPVWGAIHQV